MKFEHSQDIDFINFIFRNKNMFNNLREVIKLYNKALPQDYNISFYEKSRVDVVKHGIITLRKVLENGLQRFRSDTELNFHMAQFINHEAAGGVSFMMVRPIVEILGTEKQKQKWIPEFENCNYIGAYIQTELGHGSDVQSLETQAILDKKNNQWIINSPTISSIKWWPGDLSVSANVAVVYAQAIIDNKRIGLLPFFVQLRNFNTHEVLDGLEIGDIGSKQGYNAKDNGYIKFDNYRIPKDNLLSKFFGIENDKLILKGNPKIIYAAMIRTRMYIVHYSAFTLSRSICIAIRYSFLRKQFKNSKNQENYIIDYKLQQNKLFPLLSQCYVMIACYNQMRIIELQMEQEVKQNKFNLFKDIHILLSGVKGLFSQWNLDGIICCMQSCGGHGYNNFSGIPINIGHSAANTILEGDNQLLNLQVTRYLLKCLMYYQTDQKQKISQTCQYIKNIDQLEELIIDNKKEYFQNLQNILQIFQKTSCRKLLKLGEKFLQNEDEIIDIVNFKLGIDMLETCKIHTLCFCLQFFIDNLQIVKNKNNFKKIENLGLLFVYDQILKNLKLFIETNVLENKHINLINLLRDNLLSEIRKDCLQLANDLIFDDTILHTAIAHKNQKPYENLYNWAKKYGSINHTDMRSFFVQNVKKVQQNLQPKL